jgi:hypothetical protein
MDRVTFYSKEDRAAELELLHAEPILKAIIIRNHSSINDIIELYQIKLYIDNELYLPTWTDIDIQLFKTKAKEFWSLIIKYFEQILDDNIIELFDSLESDYQKGFWELIEKLNIFKKISSDIFNVLIQKQNIWISEVLMHKTLVNKFGSTLRDYLIEKKDSAELLLSEFEQFHENDHKQLYFPECLNQTDKELIINNYLDNPEANLNYVRLITKAREKNFKLSLRTKLKSQDLERELNDQILVDGYTWEAGNEISIVVDQDEPVKVIWDGNIQKISYGLKWLNEQNDDISLMHNFSLLFKFTNIFGCISLVSKDHELDTFEKTFIRSQNEYLTGYAFGRKNNLSHCQMLLYSKYLEKGNKSIESIISSFINNYLIDYHSVYEIKFKFSSDNTSYIEKIRQLTPEIERLLKQYNLFVEEGFIDHKLLQLYTHGIKFEDVKSIVNKKYFYGTGDKFMELKNIFFGSNNTLYYIEPYKSKYNNLFNLLTKEEVRLTDFQTYKVQTIERLINEGYLELTHDNVIRLKDQIKLHIIGRLYYDEVACYWSFSKNIRQEICKMEELGLVRFGSSLFTEPESKYFSYFWNKSEYTNGPDIRNKYTHGTNTDSEEIHKNIYFILLKLLVLILLKIENDLLVHSSSILADFY